MAFIDKKDPVVLNIKLTSKGRELLSEGKLNFTYYSIGDSEIDYNFKPDSTYNPFNNFILRPVDKNPNILSFITKNLSGDSYNIISNVSSTPTIINNSTQSLGFFNISSGSTTFLTDNDHIKQPDAMVYIDNVSGGTNLTLLKAPTYLANVNEPSIGDYILIKWTNNYDSGSTTGYNIELNKPLPILIYKIQSIISGTLSSNNLIVEVDRNLPDFSITTGNTTSNTAGALIFYNYINFTGNTVYSDYSTDYLNDSILTFLQNCQCPTITFPFWNLSIIYTEEIVGVKTTNKSFDNLSTNKYGGFVSYIQNQTSVYKKLGVIHYSNSSPSNTYGEELFVDNTNNILPTLNIPTIMWHKKPNLSLGLDLTAYGNVKYLTGQTKSLNTTYYDLADLEGNIVGKVFTDLKLFVIEDQELLFAMSYKSNRSWTLPNYTVGVNDNVVVGCPVCLVDFSVDITNPSSLNNNDGSIYVYNIINQITDTKLVLSVSGVTSGQIYFNTITNNTLISGLSADTYFVIIHDLGALNCEGKTIILSNPTSVLSIYNTGTTQSGLNPDFNINIINPTSIRIYKDDLGTIYGTGYTGILSYGSVSPVTYDQISGSYYDYNLNLLSPYTIYIKDKYTGTTEFVVSKDYVAVGDPLNSNFIISNQMSDTGGTYVIVSNYLTTINPSINPVIGNIEFSVYELTSVPLIWQSLPTGSIIGTQMKIYINGIGNYNISVRERYQTIEMFKYYKSITIV